MLKISTVRKWIVFLMILYFFFYPHLSIVNGNLLYFVLFTTILFSVVVFGFFLKCNNYVTKYQLGWGIILVISLFRNWGISNGSYLWPTAFVALILMFFALSNDTKWHDLFYKCACFIGCLFVAGTLFFLINPSAYSMMFDFWRYWPNGTEYGAYGYRAGMADNHSANGTYCVLPLLISVSILFTGDRNKKYKHLLIVVALASSLAVFLTTKRAHLIFGFAALFLTYFVFSKKKISSKLFITVGIVLLILIVICTIPNTDFLSGITSGYFDNYNDDISNGRIDYWIYALQLFLTNPVFGIGWLGFRYNSSAVLFHSAKKGAAAIGYVDAHNVYIQMLCETGIVGTVIILTVLIAFLVDTVKLYKKYSQQLTLSQHKALEVSFACQVFCLLYGLSGNFLYDRACFIYIFACALFCSVANEIRTSRRILPNANIS